MSRNLSLSQYIMRCQNCKNEYDLKKEVKVAERSRVRDLTCPHCKIKLGAIS